jgi:acetoin utilization deacetylase AcuC-like enzyme
MGGGSIDPDTMVSPESHEAAFRAAGAGLDLIDRLDRSEAETGGSLVRPPGHHATSRTQMGFCLYNNIAIAGRALADRGERVAIVDFDAHHGNGTQDVFYHDPDVLFVSLHQYPYYPGTGAADELGAGAGLGTTLNVPMPAQATGDVYRKAFDEVLLPRLDAFEPTWLLISAGFDAHRADPLTELGLTSADFADMTREMLFLVEPGRRLLFLEGGYDLQALADSAVAVAGVLLDQPIRPEAPTTGGPGAEQVEHLAQLLARQPSAD